MKSARDTEMILLYCDEQWTMQELADKYGLSRERVRQILTLHGVNRSQEEAGILRRGRSQAEHAKHADVWLADYKELGSIGAVAEKHGRSFTTISNAISDQITELERRVTKPKGKQFSNEKCIACLRAAHEHFGPDVYLSVQRYRDWMRDKVDVPSDQTVLLRFGGWTNALAQIGLKGKPKSTRGGWAKKKFDEDALTKELAYVLKKVKRLPTLEEYDTHRRPQSASGVTIRNRFGSWSNALVKLEGISK